MIARSENYFYQPDSFFPERWLPPDEHPAHFQSDRLAASNPFSVGHSNCLGKQLAWAEMCICLARVLWAFDLEAKGGTGLDWTTLKTFMIVQKQPIEVRIRVRKDMQ